MTFISKTAVLLNKKGSTYDHVNDSSEAHNNTGQNCLNAIYCFLLHVLPIKNGGMLCFLVSVPPKNGGTLKNHLNAIPEHVVPIIAPREGARINTWIG